MTSRWHSQDCTSPDVFVENDAVPRCRTCSLSAHCLLNVTEEQASPLLSIPVDEEYGSLNLRWPSTVPYRALRRPGSSQPDLRPRINPLNDIANPYLVIRDHEECHQTSSHSEQHAHKDALTNHQFRLAVLSPSPKDQLQLIHLDLETYDDDRFPDYDAVSYTWGGEMNDSRRCHPIYVGDYWDVILQTQNCCAMLRYLRPSRGTRTLWIDAICIDQSNTEERAIQVSKMGHIYSRSSQVWAWLGDDLVCEPKGLPARHWLHELDELNTGSSPSPVTLTKVLQRRYFSRLWIIQELTLAPRVVVPIGDALFRADRITARKLGEHTPKRQGLSWERTGAPWFQFMARGQIQDLKLWDIMALTSRSYASDFRDKLFGLLGLLPKDPGHIGLTLRPDYTISNRHMAIGFFAHCIRNEHKLELFYSARGNSFAPEPSWLPVWETQRSWEQIFKQPVEDRLDFYELDKAILDYEVTLHNAKVESGMVTDPLASKIAIRGVRLTTRKSYRQSPDAVKHKRGTSQPPPWHQNFLVDPNTASISMWLAKFTTINSTPRPLECHTFEGISLYKLEHDANRSIFIASRHPLHKIVQKGDEIYILHPDEDQDVSKQERLIYMILRRVDGHIFRMVACLSDLCFYTVLSQDYYRDNNIDVYEDSIAEIQESLAEKMDTIRHRLNMPVYRPDSDWTVAKGIQQAFPGHDNSTMWDLLPILTGNEDLNWIHKNPKCTRLQTRVVNGFLELTFGREYWETDRSVYLDRFSDVRWEYWSAKEGWSGLEQPVGNFLKLCIRCFFPLIEHQFKMFERGLGIQELWKTGILGGTLDAFKSRLLAGPTEEDHYRTTPERSNKLLSDANLDGRTYEVILI